ncbi:MAG: TIGR02206 family membrane protein [Planctomycetota bacterium]|nr:TIGR02206 family membrane protein [Planctomycetota bacterium]
MLDAFFIENYTFRPFTVEHFMVLASGTLFFLWVILYARKCSPQRQLFLGALIGYAIITIYFFLFISLDAIRHGFEPKKHLPFHLCNVCGISCWLVLHKRNYLAYEVLFFWILSGTLAACLIPELKHSFPHYAFFAFWILHVGLVGSALYATFVYGMRPRGKSLFTAFIALNLYAVLVGLINGLLHLMGYVHANYFYVCHKPDVPTPLDWFGKWPWYIFGGQILAAGIFILIYLPFLISDRLQRRREQASDNRSEPADPTSGQPGP